MRLHPSEELREKTVRAPVVRQEEDAGRQVVAPRHQAREAVFLEVSQAEKPAAVDADAKRQGGVVGAARQGERLAARRIEYLQFDGWVTRVHQDVASRELAVADSRFLEIPEKSPARPEAREVPRCPERVHREGVDESPEGADVVVVGVAEEYPGEPARSGAEHRSEEALARTRAPPAGVDEEVAAPRQAEERRVALADVEVPDLGRRGSERRQGGAEDAEREDRSPSLPAPSISRYAATTCQGSGAGR